MTHAKWNFNVMLPVTGRLPVCLLMVAVIFSGCQNSNDDYRVITEEMSQPVAQETSLTESKTENSVSESNSPKTNDGTNDSPEPVRSNNEPETVATVEPVKPTQATEPTAQPDQQPATKSTASVASTTNGTPQAQAAEAGKKVNGFINLQAEIDRQKRMQKLGFGQTRKPSEPREIKLLVKEREFFQEPKMDALRVSYNDLDLLKVLNMEPVPLNAQDYLPEWLTALDGKKVILRGWMFPPLQTEGLKGFIFVRDNQVCCFGPNAKAYDKLTVRLKKGNTTNYIQGRPFDVIGTFKIDAWVEDERDMRTGKFVEKLGMLYHIEDAVVVD